jgi:D-lactate dehydrogenase
MSFPNVLITAHQAFFTKEAMDQIAMTTLKNITHLLGDKKIDAQALQHDLSILVV